ncbi:24844_t:CDS:2 [Gigaspora rosea]|nr:24844_t:CDS:2 [Gigaspora rosea]
MNTSKFENESAAIQIEENLKHESKTTYNQLYQFATNLDFLIMFVGLVFSSIAGVAMPLMTVIYGKMVDYLTLIQNHEISEDEFSYQISKYSLYLIYIAIITFVATYIYMATWVYTGERITQQIRERYLRAILCQNIAYFDNVSAGEITTRIVKDTYLIQDGISENASLSFQTIWLKSIIGDTSGKISRGVTYNRFKSTISIYKINVELILSFKVINAFFAVIIGAFSLANIAPDLQAFAIAVGAGAKILKTIDLVPPIDSASPTGEIPDHVEGHFQFKKVSFSYPSRPNVKVLDNISFYIESGTYVAIVGASGSGKINNVAHGLIGSIYEELSVEEKYKMIKNACEISNADEFIVRLPNQYETMVGEGGILLSGGQKQRIAIARAIVRDPKILFLDEATSALDSQSEKLVQDALNKASKNRTVNYYCYSSIVYYPQCHKIIVMNEGAVIEYGSHYELIAKGGTYYNLFNSQQLQQNNEVGEIIVQSEGEIIEEHKYESTSSILTNIKNDYEYTTWELIKKILRISQPEILVILIGLFVSIVNGCIYPIFTVIFSNILQSFTKIDNELKRDAKIWSLMFLVIAVGTLICNFIQGTAFGYSGEKLILRVRSATFASILRQNISFFDEEKHTTGVLTSELALNATYLNGLAGATLSTLLQLCFTVFGGLILALIVGWKFALVCMSCIPVIIGSGILRIKMLNGFQQKTKKAYESSAQFACESTKNIRTVAALTHEEDRLRIYYNMLDEPMHQGFKIAFLISIIFAVAQSVIFLTNALAFWYSSRLIIVGEYDIRKMFTVFVAVIFGSMSAGRAFAFAPDIAKARTAAASIISLIEGVPTIDTWSNTDLDIKPGQYAALVGPSGCGKTTIISLIKRFYDITNGKVEIDGIDISALNENVIFGCRPGQQATQEDVENACREANIHDFIIALPDGYDTHVGGKGMQLSGGQKQRIAIARALIRNSRILLLDEATSALDSGSEKAVQKALDIAAKGRTTLAITHRLSTIKHVDVIFVIKDGKVHEQGTHQELLLRKGIYYTMMQEQ